MAAPDFATFTVEKLKEYLRQRDVPVSDSTKSVLVARAQGVHTLNIACHPTDDEYTTGLTEAVDSKLKLEGGLITLPHPRTLVTGWEDGACNFPDTMSSQVDAFFRRG